MNLDLLSLARALAAASLAAGLQVAVAQPVRMDFEGLSPSVAGEKSNVLVGTFYNGGSSLSLVDGSPVAAGALPGIGVSFNSGAVAAETALGGNGGMVTVFGPTRNLLLANGDPVLASPALGTGVVFGGSQSFIDVGYATGFTTGLSFFFNALSALNVSLLRADGTTLASADFRLPSTGLCPTGESRCEWNAATLAFAGTAYGVRFSGTEGDFALDNITLGQIDPLGALVSGGGGGGGTGGGGDGGGDGGGGSGGGGTPPVTPIPEPSTYVLMALGLAWVVWTTRQSRRRAAVQRIS